VPIWPKTARSVLVLATQEADLEVGESAIDDGTPFPIVLPSGAREICAGLAKNGGILGLGW
jgi:hypothetical protein